MGPAPWRVDLRGQRRPEILTSSEGGRLAGRGTAGSQRPPGGRAGGGGPPSGKRRLELLTSSEAERLARSDTAGSYRALWACSAAAVALLATLPLVDAVNTPAIATLALLWLGAPLVSWWLSRPLSTAPAALDAAGRELVTLVARTTWRWFETFVTEHEHWLPPDNGQEHPIANIAGRTSPTNIGMALLADLAANDLGYITPEAVVERCGRTLDTLERLERHRGHLYNWYDTRTLAPLLPPWR